MSKEAQKRVSAVTRRSKPLTLAATSLGFVVVQLDVTIVNVALPQIDSSLGGGVAGLQWVVSAYTLVFAAAILTAGALGDRFGAKRCFITGFFVFTLASLGCGFAPNLASLIGARAVQGLGAAVLVPCSLALLNHAFHDEHGRTKAIGIWAAGASAALAAGPVVGGALIAWIGWRSIFFVNLPLGIFGIWMTWRYAEESTQTRSRALDLAGQFIGMFALADLAAAMIEGGAIGWTHPLVLVAFLLFVLAAMAFVFVEIKVESPMLPVSLFKNSTFSAATAIGLLMNTAFYGLIFMLSLYFQQVKHYTPLATGMAFLPMTVVVLFANLSAGPIAARLGLRMPILIGQILLAIGCLSLIRISQSTSYSGLGVQMLAMGAGVGLTVPPMTSALLGTVDTKLSGVASGVLNASRQAGSVVGVALLGSLIERQHPFIPGIRMALMISVGVVLAGCFSAFLIRPEKHGTKKHAV
jgi:MFS transporter, DHA2 family, methylenomycin A resistance protein